MHRKRIWIIRLLAVACIFHCVCLEYSLVLCCFWFVYPSPLPGPHHLSKSPSKLVDYSSFLNILKFLSEPLSHFCNFPENLKIAHLISWSVKSSMNWPRPISVWVLTSLTRHRFWTLSTGKSALRMSGLILSPEVSVQSGPFADGEQLSTQSSVTRCVGIAWVALPCFLSCCHR